ncbi:hypothetical protein V6N13_083056 [Hibiscus sabdariffa]
MRIRCRPWNLCMALQILSEPALEVPRRDSYTDRKVKVEELESFHPIEAASIDGSGPLIAAMYKRISRGRRCSNKYHFQSPDGKVKRQNNL